MTEVLTDTPKKDVENHHSWLVKGILAVAIWKFLKEVYATFRDISPRHM